MKKIITLLTALILCSATSFSQCTVSFIYSNGSNGSVSFTSTATGTGPFLYQWFFGDSSYSYAANPTHNYWYNTTYNVCVKITDSINFCSDSTCYPVTVSNAAQTASCPGNASFTAAANGSLTTFTNSAGNWKIDFGDGSPVASTSSSGINHQYNYNGSYQVTAIAYSYYGNYYLPCDTDVQTIVVGNIPCQSSFSLFADTSDGHLYAHSTSLGESNNTWYLNGNVVASNADSLVTVLLPGTYNVCLVITGPNSCSDSSCQTFTMNYTVPCPGVTFSYVPLSACDSYQFSINNTGPPLTSVNWMLNGTSVSSSLTTPITFDFTSAQNNVYAQSVSVSVSGNGCSATQYFSFYNPASFYINLDTSSTGGNIWYAYPQNTAGVTSEAWDFGDGNTSSLQYPTNAYVIPGFYTVCHSITVNGTCTYTYCDNQYFWRISQSQGVSYFIVVNPTGIAEQHPASQKVKIFPNPTSGIVTFGLEKSSVANTYLHIYNSAGMELRNEKVNEGVKTFSCDLSLLPGGIYNYQLRNAKNTFSKGQICIKK